MVDFGPGCAVIDAAHRKRVKYEAKCADIGYGFLPFSFSSLGELDKDADGFEAAQRKRAKYEAKCTYIGYGFLPLSFSSFGELEEDTVTLLKRI
ncbi:hypothetical protein Tco_1411618 [Tanacetum coccineum]